MKLIDRYAVVAEIEKLYKKNTDRCSIEGIAAAAQLRMVLDFLDTLEVKEVDTATTEQLIEAAKTVVRERHEYRPLSIYLLEEALESLGEKWEE